MEKVSTPREAAEVAMQLAVDKADREIADWSETAYQFLLEYARKHRKFQAWQVREAAVGQIPLPTESRAWGAVFSRANRDGVIVSIGFVPVANKGSHGRAQTLWLSLVFSERAWVQS